MACFPDLAREWNYDKNGVLTPDKIRFGSKKKVWWKCALGHEWQAVVSSRTNPSSGRGCPICYREYKTSFPEQAVFYYVKHFFDDAISGYISDGFEIDIFIPSLSFGVEYDGMAYHTGKKNGDKEERKNTYCKSKGIKLVRLKETIDNLLADSDGIIWCHYTPNNTFLNSAIKTLMSQYLLIANPEVDVTRDSIAIQEQYVCSVKDLPPAAYGCPAGLCRPFDNPAEALTVFVVLTVWEEQKAEIQMGETHSGHHHSIPCCFLLRLVRFFYIRCFSTAPKEAPLFSEMHRMGCPFAVHMRVTFSFSR